MLRSRQNKSSKSPLSDASPLSTSPTITIDPASATPLHPVDSRLGALLDRTQTLSPHLLAPSASSSNWRRWLRPGSGNKQSTPPGDLPGQVKDLDRNGNQGRKSRDSRRPSGDMGPPIAPTPLLRKSGSSQPLNAHVANPNPSGIKPSSSRIFGRRSTVTTLDSEELTAYSSTGSPPLPSPPPASHMSQWQSLHDPCES